MIPFSSVLLCPLNQIHAAIRANASGKVTIAEGVETSVIYVRFKAAAAEVAAIMKQAQQNFSCSGLSTNIQSNFAAEACSQGN